jgi:hypothetical protein
MFVVPVLSKVSSNESWLPGEELPLVLVLDVEEEVEAFLVLIAYRGCPDGVVNTVADGSLFKR